MLKKIVTLLTFTAAFATTSAQAQHTMDGMKGMDMSSPAATDSKAIAGTGTVKKADRSGGTVTLAHGPIKALNWPAMTMGFKVKDPALFDKLTPEKQVNFELAKEGSDYVVTSVK